MKIASRVLLYFLATIPCLSEALPRIGDSPPPGAKALWNGHTLEGWTVYLGQPVSAETSTWEARDRSLRFHGLPKGYIRSIDTFSNFHLHVEWRWPDKEGNSGVFVHLSGPDRIWPTSLECQLRSGIAGQLIGTGVAIPGAPIIKDLPRVPNLSPSSEAPLKQWNAYDIFCRGDTIDVYVNGVHQNHAENISVQEGAIGLQMEGTPIEFRNIWIRAN